MSEMEMEQQRLMSELAAKRYEVEQNTRIQLEKIASDRMVETERVKVEWRKFRSMKSDQRAMVLGGLVGAFAAISIVTVVASANIASEFAKVEAVKAWMVQPGMVWVANENGQMECRKA